MHRDFFLGADRTAGYAKYQKVGIWIPCNTRLQLPKGNPCNLLHMYLHSASLALLVMPLSSVLHKWDTCLEGGNNLPD